MALIFLRADGRGVPATPSGAHSGSGRQNGYPPAALGYSLAMVLCLIIGHFWTSADYVGADNDDVMRLIEVRDLLGGQAWYDMTQYRLGLAGGTLMHWSRFIDLPIAFLIGFFRLFASPERAEALALAVWPLALAATIVWLIGLAGLRAGGRVAMHVASGMAILYVYGMGRFGIGSIDHHNAQLTLAALILAMLMDPAGKVRSHAVAGTAAGFSLSIGAETVPFVAGVCLAVAAQWGWYGRARGRQTSAFSMALVFTVSAAFLATTPPHLYGMVTCDNLSLGFYSIASVGGFLLFLAALTGGVVRLDRMKRVFILLLIGLAVLGTARAIAPQCLGNPLSDLDPMLTELWLGKVVEARSFMAQIRVQPSLAGGFYAVGFLAVLVCLWRILRRDRKELHLVLGGLSLTSLAVALVQVRGTMYSNLIAILPMTLLVCDLRAWQQRAPEKPLRVVAYLGTVLLSLPLIWSVGGLLLSKGVAGLAAGIGTEQGAQQVSCTSRQALAPLADQPAGVVMAPSDLGVHILRFTPHRVLSAPYHRDQGGMLTELNAGLSISAETPAFLRGADIGYVVFCPQEVQTRDLAAMKPDGFYAALMRGDVPAYLEAVSGRPGEMQIFRAKLD